MTAKPRHARSPSDVSVNDFAPGSFEHAAVQRGLHGVIDLARSRCGSIAPVGVHLRRIVADVLPTETWSGALIEGQADRLAEVYEQDGWPDLVARLIATGTVACLLAPTALLSLMIAENGSRRPNRQAYARAARLHTLLDAHAIWRGGQYDDVTVRSELLERASRVESSSSVRGRKPRPLSFRAQTAVAHACDALGLDFDRRLPPSPSVLSLVIDELGRAGETPDGGELRACVAAAAMDDPVLYIERWAALDVELVRKVRAIIGQMRNREPNRSAELGEIHGRAYGAVLRRAADLVPTHRPRAPGDHLCAELIDVHCWLKGSSQPLLSMTSGYASGPAHDFIVATGELYGIHLVGEASSAGYRRRR
jgi:hypothetical protein